MGVVSIMSSAVVTKIGHHGAGVLQCHCWKYFDMLLHTTCCHLILRLVICQQNYSFHPSHNVSYNTVLKCLGSVKCLVNPLLPPHVNGVCCELTWESLSHQSWSRTGVGDDRETLLSGDHCSLLISSRSTVLAWHWAGLIVGVQTSSGLIKTGLLTNCWNRRGHFCFKSGWSLIIHIKIMG